MSDVPDDLTSVGRHHGNEPPTDTGQEVRSPEGPDPRSTKADPSPALYQLLQDTTDDRIQIRTHSPRADVTGADGTFDEVDQYRTVDALREGLQELQIDGSFGVFEDADADDVLTDSNVTADHPWIGQSRFPRITFFPSSDAASTFVAELDQEPASD